MNRKDKKFIPVMLMPFQEDKTIDYPVLAALIERYLQAGAGGLFANCLSSEMFELSQQEMLESVAFIVNQVQGRVPVVATGTFEDSLENQAAFIKAIYATGVDCVILTSGLLAKEEDSEETFRSRVQQLLKITDDIPLGFYECPVPYKRILAADFLGELVKTGRIEYHKDTSLDITSIRAKIHRTKDVKDFGLYDAYMGHALESLRAGAAGLSCIQGNYFPELLVWLCTHFDHSDKQTDVQAVQAFFIENMDVMHYAYPNSAKYVLGKSLPIQLESRRTDIEKLDENARIKLDRLVESYHRLVDKIGNLVG